MSYKEHFELRIRIIHETNPRKYFGAIYCLAEQERLTISGAHRYSLAKESLRVALWEKKSMVKRLPEVIDDLKLRVSLPILKGEVIVLAIAPWDWRIFLYRHLADANQVIYHTSWPDWSTRRVPRTYFGFEYLYKRVWLEFLNEPNVQVVAVQPRIAAELAGKFGIAARVIPHCVSREFFEAGTSRETQSGTGCRLLFVGELSEKKGVRQVIEVARQAADRNVKLSIAGDGPLRSLCEVAASTESNIDFLGPVSSRSEMAEIMSNHDLLLVLSQRTSTWEELFGMVIIEALASGMGVIATDHVGPRTIFGERGLGNLFDESDLEGVVKLVGELALDNGLRRAFVRRQRHIADCYHINYVAELWAEAVGLEHAGSDR